jgi:peptidoglycan hydrolase CwlO-like protein
MRKYIIGFIAGILVATAGIAGAETISLVGKKIQSEAVVTLDGKEIGTAIITDGTSYLPIRTLADATGLKVGYQKGNIKLETKTELPRNLENLDQRLEDLTWSLNSWQKMLANTQRSIDGCLENIAKWQGVLDTLAPDASDEIKADYQSRIGSAETEIIKLEIDLAERSAKVEEVEAEIELVKAEIERLKKK